MKTKLKKHGVKILTLIICMVTLVTVLVVPTFAYSDLGEMTPSATACDRNASIGSVIQLRAKGAWNKRDTYSNLQDFDDNYMLFRTDNGKYMYLKIDIFDSAGGKDLTTTLQFQEITFDWYYIDDVVGVKIYLDCDLVLDIARTMSNAMTLGVYYYGIDGCPSYLDWTNAGYFDMYFYMNYAWLVDMNGFGDINPLYSFFDYIAVTAPSAYNSGSSVGYDEGYANGWDVGYEEGEADGYTNGFAEGYDIGSEDSYWQGWDVGYEEGEADGYTNGFAEGYDIGSEDSYWQGWDDGFDEGWDVGFEVGLDNGYDVGFDEGYSGGYDVGYAEGDLSGREIGLVTGYFNGYADAKDVWYQNGLKDGFNGADTSQAWSNMKNLIFAIFDAPFYVISTSLDFNLFGINIAGTLIALISLAIIVWILKIIVVKFF